LSIVADGLPLVEKDKQRSVRCKKNFDWRYARRARV